MRPGRAPAASDELGVAEIGEADAAGQSNHIVHLTREGFALFPREDRAFEPRRAPQPTPRRTHDPASRTYPWPIDRLYGSAGTDVLNGGEGNDM